MVQVDCYWANEWKKWQAINLETFQRVDSHCGGPDQSCRTWQELFQESLAKRVIQQIDKPFVVSCLDVAWWSQFKGFGIFDYWESFWFILNSQNRSSPRTTAARNWERNDGLLNSAGKKWKDSQNFTWSTWVQSLSSASILCLRFSANSSKKRLLPRSPRKCSGIEKNNLLVGYQSDCQGNFPMVRLHRIEGHKCVCLIELSTKIQGLCFNLHNPFFKHFVIPKFFHLRNVGLENLEPDSDLCRPA